MRTDNLVVYRSHRTDRKLSSSLAARYVVAWMVPTVTEKVFPCQRATTHNQRVQNNRSNITTQRHHILHLCYVLYRNKNVYKCESECATHTSTPICCCFFLRCHSMLWAVTKVGPKDVDINTHKMNVYR